MSILNRNPFDIQTDVNINNLRQKTRKGSVAVLQLFESIKKLPIDNNQSVIIPITIANDKKKANALILGVKRQMKIEKYDCVITIRTILDSQGKYVNTRIFKIK